MPCPGTHPDGDPTQQLHDPAADSGPGGAHDDVPRGTPPLAVPDMVPPRWYGTQPASATIQLGSDRTPANTSNAQEPLEPSETGVGDAQRSDTTAGGGATTPTFAVPTETGDPDDGVSSHRHRDIRDENRHSTSRQGSTSQNGRRTMSPDAADHRRDEDLPKSGDADEFDRRDVGQLADDRTVHDASARDLARTVRAALVGSDLLRSGPVLWPFGRRARERRAHNQRVAEEAARRRVQLREAFDAACSTNTPTDQGQPGDAMGHAPAAARGQRADRQTQTVLVACLTGLVLAVVLAMLWLAGPEPTEEASQLPQDPSPAPTSTPDTATSPPATQSTADQSLAPLPPIPPSGVTPVPTRPGEPVDPRSVTLVDPPTTAPTRGDLSTPDGAMRAWLARWCPFDYTDLFGTAERRAQPAMTEAGWATLNPDNDTPTADRLRASWDKTLAARESGRCAEPVAVISPEAPRADSSAIVIGAITRVITSDSSGQAPYVEQLTEVRIVQRGPDGLWRVDLAATGG